MVPDVDGRLLGDQAHPMDLTRRTFVILGAGALIGAACTDDEPSVRPEAVPPDDVPENPADSAGEAGEARLTGWLVTRWAADPFALGSYSYLPVGATPAASRGFRP